MFPKDIWFLIFLHTSPMDWIKFSIVCKDFYKWIITDSDARLWSKMRLKEHIWCFEDASTDLEIYKKIGELSKQSVNMWGEFIINLLFPFKNIYNNITLTYDIRGMNVFWKNDHKLFGINYSRIIDYGYFVWNGDVSYVIPNEFILYVHRKILRGEYNFSKQLVEFEFGYLSYDNLKELNESPESAEATTKRIKK